MTKPLPNEQISPVPWYFVKSKFHCVGKRKEKKVKSLYRDWSPGPKVWEGAIFVTIVSFSLTGYGSGERTSKLFIVDLFVAVFLLENWPTKPGCIVLK